MAGRGSSSVSRVTPVRPAVAIGADVAAVAVFVVVGRLSHDEGLTAVGFLQTFWPFALCLVLGQLSVQIWRSPPLWLSGWAIWGITWAGGLTARILLTTDTAKGAFAVVAAITLGVLMLGWRLVADRIERRLRARLRERRLQYRSGDPTLN